MIVLVCGGRNWDDRKKIYDRLSELDPDADFVIQGGARGADSIVGEVCRELEISYARIAARWTRYGKPAGPIRNKLMLALHKILGVECEIPVDLVIAFHDDLSASVGTKDMVNEANRRGIKVEHYT